MTNRYSLLHRRFDKMSLPHPIGYYEKEFPELKITPKWATARCPFHNDHKPSLNITGGFRCFACGAHGGDVVAFQMQRYQMSFIDAVGFFGAWRHD